MLLDAVGIDGMYSALVLIDRDIVICFICDTLSKMLWHHIVFFSVRYVDMVRSESIGLFG